MVNHEKLQLDHWNQVPHGVQALPPRPSKGLLRRPCEARMAKPSQCRWGRGRLAQEIEAGVITIRIAVATNVCRQPLVKSLSLAEISKRISREDTPCCGGFLIGIAPSDEFEGMVAGHLVACHNASMECYRRAMIGE